MSTQTDKPCPTEGREPLQETHFRHDGLEWLGPAAAGVHALNMLLYAMYVFIIILFFIYIFIIIIIMQIMHCIIIHIHIIMY